MNRNLNRLIGTLGLVVLVVVMGSNGARIRAQTTDPAPATVVKPKLLQRDTTVQYVIAPRKPHKLGWFGAPMLEVTRLFDQTAAFVGGGIAMLIDRHFYVGVYAQNLATGVQDSVPTPQGPSFNSLHLLHGGLLAGYNVLYAKVVHLTASLKLGGGRVTERTVSPNGLGQLVAEDDIFLITPHVGLNVNVTPFLQLSLEAGYRFSTGIDLLGVSSSDFDGPLGLLGFRFGRF